MNYIRRIASYSFRYWERLLLSGITAVLFGLFSAVPTWGLGKVIDIIFVNRQQHLLPLFIFLFFYSFHGKRHFYVCLQLLHAMGWQHGGERYSPRSFQKNNLLPALLFQIKGNGRAHVLLFK